MRHAPADRRDAITLIALATVDTRRGAVLERLMEQSPAPGAEISVESAVMNAEHFATWRNDILQI